MSYYAQVVNNVVVNTVVADSSWAGLEDGVWIEYTDESPCGIGWTVTNGVCNIPPPPPQPE
jgi:hypothetical protein